MIKRNIANLILLLTVLCCFSSCEVDITLDNSNNPDNLFGPIWEDRFIDDTGADCIQTFEFYRDGRGVECMDCQGYGGSVSYNKYPFHWEWDNEHPYSLFLDYPNNDFSYFGNLRIGRDRLEGILNDEPLTFRAVY